MGEACGATAHVGVDVGRGQYSSKEFNRSMKDKTHQYIFTKSNNGYLNSTILIVMVTAAINANDR